MELSIQKFSLEGLAHVTRRSVRMVMFTLGAFPQALKLFSCRGIPFIQFIASCYLLDFMNDEIILWYTQSKCYQQQKSDNPASVVNRHLELLNPSVPQDEWLFVDCSMAFNLCWILCVGAAGALFQGPLGWLEWVIPMSVIAIIQYSFLYAERKSWIRLSKRVKFEIRLLLFPMAMIPFWISTLQYYKRKDQSWMLWTEIFSSYKAFQLYKIVQAAVSSFKMMRWTMEVYDRGHPDDFPAFLHMLLLPIALGLYFVFHYEAAVTYKPSWVDWLG